MRKLRTLIMTRDRANDSFEQTDFIPSKNKNVVREVYAFISTRYMKLSFMRIKCSFFFPGSNLILRTNYENDPQLPSIFSYYHLSKIHGSINLTFQLVDKKMQRLQE